MAKVLTIEPHTFQVYPPTPPAAQQPVLFPGAAPPGTNQNFAPRPTATVPPPPPATIPPDVQNQLIKFFGLDTFGIPGLTGSHPNGFAGAVQVASFNRSNLRERSSCAYRSFEPLVSLFRVFPSRRHPLTLAMVRLLEFKGSSKIIIGLFFRRSCPGQSRLPGSSVASRK